MRFVDGRLNTGEAWWAGSMVERCAFHLFAGDVGRPHMKAACHVRCDAHGEAIAAKKSITISLAMNIFARLVFLDDLCLGFASLLAPRLLLID